VRRENDRLAEHQAVLGAAEADDVRARARARVTGSLGRTDAESGGRVGQPGAVDVYGQAGAVRYPAQLGYLRERVQGAQLGRLADGQRGGASLVHVVVMPDRLFQPGRDYLA